MSIRRTILTPGTREEMPFTYVTNPHSEAREEQFVNSGAMTYLTPDEREHARIRFAESSADVQSIAFAVYRRGSIYNVWLSRNAFDAFRPAPDHEPTELNRQSEDRAAMVLGVSTEQDIRRWLDADARRAFAKAFTRNDAARVEGAAIEMVVIPGGPYTNPSSGKEDGSWANTWIFIRLSRHAFETYRALFEPTVPEQIAGAAAAVKGAMKKAVS